MANSNRIPFWFAAVVAAIVVGIVAWFTAAWFTLENSPEAASTTRPETNAYQVRRGATAGPDSVGPTADADGTLRIVEHGRLRLDADALPSDGPLSLVLELSDEARGHGDHTVRIISTDGRRLDTTASPVAGSGTGVRLEIDAGFLSPGLYMIEIETEDKTPLRLRRYVLELE